MSTEKPAIHFCLPIGLSLGGVNVWCCDMANALVERGINVSLICHSRDGSDVLHECELDDRIQIIPCGGAPGLHAHPRDVAKFMKVYERLSPGLLFPNYSVGTFAACAALVKRRPGDFRVIGLVGGINSDLLDMAAYYEPAISKYIAVSKEVKAGVSKRLIGASDVEVKPCPAALAPSLTRKWSEQKDNPIVLTYAGRITNHEKCVSRLIPLARGLSKERVNFRMRILGSGGYAQTLLDELAESSQNVKDRVQYEGMLSPRQVQKVWMQSDVCVLVSDAEGSPLSLIEAMGHGCVPVVTDVSGVRRAVTPGSNGFVVPVWDMAAAIEHITYLDSHRSALPIMGTKAHAAVQDYSMENYLAWFVPMILSVWNSSEKKWPMAQPIYPAYYLQEMKKTKQSNRRACIKRALLRIQRRIR